jgi:RNA recognition motif-containing protein
LNIYVGNLSIETTADELRQEFTQFGAVLSVTIMNDKYIGSGQPRGYGYVEMASKSEGTTAIANIGGRTLRDRILSVVEALPLTDKSGKIPADKINPLKRRGERKRQNVN